MGAVLEIDSARLDAFCARWDVKTLEVFGSVPRDDFGPESDVDVLVTFESEARPTLFDLAAMEDELSALVGRPVDLVSRRGVEASRNHVRRAAILSSARALHGTR